jgi:hypothetical protein
VERAAEQRGRHGCLGGGREARGDSEIGRAPTASETGRTNVLDVAAGWPRTVASSLRAGPGAGRRLRLGWWVGRWTWKRAVGAAWQRLGRTSCSEEKFYRTSLNYCPIYLSY